MKLIDYLKKAKSGKWAIGQFNFSTLEQIKGAFKAAFELQSPIILGTSEGEANYFGVEQAVALCGIFKKEYGVPAFLNLDHAKDLNLIKKAISAGYDAIHFDGSMMRYEENVEIAKKVANLCHKNKIIAEGELGIIRGESVLHKGEKAEIKGVELTDPGKAKDFSEKTKVDNLAVAIGTIHGIYDLEPMIDFLRLEKINNIIKNFLVLHGGSGISENDLKKAISLGITKINFNTEIRVVWKENLLKIIQETEELRPYKILPQLEEKIKEKVKEKILQLGSCNKI